MQSTPARICRQSKPACRCLRNHRFGRKSHPSWLSFLYFHHSTCILRHTRLNRSRHQLRWLLGCHRRTRSQCTCRSKGKQTINVSIHVCEQGEAAKCNLQVSLYQHSTGIDHVAMSCTSTTRGVDSLSVCRRWIPSRIAARRV